MKLAWLVYRLEYRVIFCCPLFSCSKEKNNPIGQRKSALYLYFLKKKYRINKI